MSERNAIDIGGVFTLKETKITSKKQFYTNIHKWQVFLSDENNIINLGKIIILYLHKI